MQVCHSIGHICRTIRTAREIDRKTPSKVYKAFNDRTGELLVGGVQIHKSTWSVAIPTAISEWDKHLSLLFHDHSPGSQFPLSYIYNIQNDIVLADHDSYVSVQGSQPNRILLNQYKPTLTKWVNCNNQFSCFQNKSVMSKFSLRWQWQHHHSYIWMLEVRPRMPCILFLWCCKGCWNKTSSWL